MISKDFTLLALGSTLFVGMKTHSLAQQERWTHVNLFPHPFAPVPSPSPVVPPQFGCRTCPWSHPPAVGARLSALAPALTPSTFLPPQVLGKLFGISLPVHPVPCDLPQRCFGGCSPAGAALSPFPPPPQAAGRRKEQEEAPFYDPLH